MKKLGERTKKILHLQGSTIRNLEAHEVKMIAGGATMIFTACRPNCVTIAC